MTKEAEFVLHGILGLALIEIHISYFEQMQLNHSFSMYVLGTYYVLRAYCVPGILLCLGNVVRNRRNTVAGLRELSLCPFTFVSE